MAAVGRKPGPGPGLFADGPAAAAPRRRTARLSWIVRSARSGRAALAPQRLRHLQVLLQVWQNLVGEAGRRVIRLLGFPLEFFDILLVISDHVLGERLVELVAGQLRQAVIFR